MRVVNSFLIFVILSNICIGCCSNVHCGDPKAVDIQVQLYSDEEQEDLFLNGTYDSDSINVLTLNGNAVSFEYKILQDSNTSFISILESEVGDYGYRITAYPDLDITLYTNIHEQLGGCCPYLAIMLWDVPGLEVVRTDYADRYRILID